MTLSSGISVGAGAHVSTGTTVIQGVHGGNSAIFGAGTVAIRDFPDGAIVLGIPGMVVKA